MVTRKDPQGKGRRRTQLTAADRKAIAHVLRMGEGSAALPDKARHYVEGLYVALRSEQRNFDKGFLVAYADVVECEKIPLLPIYSIMSMLRKQIKFDTLKSDIIILANRIKGESPPFWWWELMITEGHALSPDLRNKYWSHLGCFIASGSYMDKNRELFSEYIVQFFRNNVIEEVNSYDPKRGYAKQHKLRWSIHRILGRSIISENPEMDVLTTFFNLESYQLIFWEISVKFLNYIIRVCDSRVLVKIFSERENGLRTFERIWRLHPDIFTMNGPKVREIDIGSNLHYAFGVMWYLAGGRRLPDPFDYWMPFLDGCGLDWMIHMLRGGSMRNAPGLPFRLSRRTPQVFQTLIADHNEKGDGLNETLVLADLIACGVGTAFAHAVGGGGGLFAYNSIEEMRGYALRLVSMGFTIEEVRIVGDYLTWYSRLGEPVNIQRMSRATLMRRVNAWHLELGDRQRLREQEFEEEIIFPKMPIEDHKEFHDGSEYRITQIKTAARLFEEGKQLQHCVVSYSRACKEGKTAIFSLHVMDGEQEKPLVTIQVTGRTVIQCLGSSNRRPTDLEWSMIQNWVNANPKHLSGGIQLW